MTSTAPEPHTTIEDTSADGFISARRYLRTRWPLLTVLVVLALCGALLNRTLLPARRAGGPRRQRLRPAGAGFPVVAVGWLGDCRRGGIGVVVGALRAHGAYARPRRRAGQAVGRIGRGSDDLFPASRGLPSFVPPSAVMERNQPPCPPGWYAEGWGWCGVALVGRNRVEAGSPTGGRSTGSGHWRSKNSSRAYFSWRRANMPATRTEGADRVMSRWPAFIAAFAAAVCAACTSEGAVSGRASVGSLVPRPVWPASKTSGLVPSIMSGDVPQRRVSNRYFASGVPTHFTLATPSTTGYIAGFRGPNIDGFDLRVLVQKTQAGSYGIAAVVAYERQADLANPEGNPVHLGALVRFRIDGEPAIGYRYTTQYMGRKIAVGDVEVAHVGQGLEISWIGPVASYPVTSRAAGQIMASLHWR